MKQLDRYIGSTVFFSVLIVFFVVVSLDVIFGFIGEMDRVENDYQAFDAFTFTMLTIPRRIYSFIPVCALMGCLVGLGSLASRSELTVMRAAGVSVLRIVFAAAKPIVFIVIAGLCLGQFVVPQLEQYAQSERALKKDGGEVISARSGYWYREENRFIHITAIQPNGVMYGVARFQYDADGLLISSDISEKAIYQGDHWILQGVKSTLLDMDHTSSNTLSRLRWDTAITPDILSIVVLKPDYLSISGLYTYAGYLAAQGLDSAPYYFAFWKKVFQPIATIIMVFIAASFIFGPLRSVTLGQRITAGVVTGLGFHYVQDILGHISIVFHVSPVLAAGIPIVVCMAAGIYMLRRV